MHNDVCSGFKSSYILYLIEGEGFKSAYILYLIEGEGFKIRKHMCAVTSFTILHSKYNMAF